jgi:ABC-type transport system, involved in lipoprotein release, permease component
MKQVSLSIMRLSIYNVKRKLFRTACLSFLVGILAFTLFGGSILSCSLRNGMNSMKQRFGADLMVVPKGNETKSEGILLKGEPNYFYFDQSVANQVEKIKGVSQVSSQFYLSSLSADCCSASVELIGIDPDTDFVIQPWISKSYRGGIKDGQLIVGSDIILDSNKTLKFYGDTYPVAAQLEKTATGLDYSVFMNMNTMQQLFAGAKKAGMNFLKTQKPGNSISNVQVRLDKNYDTDKIAREIKTTVPGTDVILPKVMFKNISNHLETLVTYAQTISVVLWVLIFVILSIAFSVTINERKKEFAVFRILGATRKKLIALLLTEALVISMIGSSVGIIAASVIVFPFSTYIGDQLQLPYLLPKQGIIAGVLGMSLLFSLIVGPLTSIVFAIKISKAETYLTMREGE